MESPLSRTCPVLETPGKMSLGNTFSLHGIEELHSDAGT